MMIPCHFDYYDTAAEAPINPWTLLVQSKERSQKRSKALHARLSHINMDILSETILSRSVRRPNRRDRNRMSTVEAVKLNEQLIELLVKHPHVVQHRAILSMSETLPKVIPQISFTVASLSKALKRGQRRFGTRRYANEMWDDIVQHIKDGTVARVNLQEAIETDDGHELEEELITEFNKLSKRFGTVTSLAKLFDMADRLQELSYVIDPELVSKQNNYMAPATKRMQDVVKADEWIGRSHEMIRFGNLFHHCLGSYVGRHDQLSWFVRLKNAVAEVNFRDGKFITNQCYGPHDKITPDSKRLVAKLKALNSLDYTEASLMEDLKLSPNWDKWKGRDAVVEGYGNDDMETPF
jgi:hypothetical protein